MLPSPRPTKSLLLWRATLHSLGAASSSTNQARAGISCRTPKTSTRPSPPYENRLRPMGLPQTSVERSPSQGPPCQRCKFDFRRLPASHSLRMDALAGVDCSGNAVPPLTSSFLGCRGFGPSRRAVPPPGLAPPPSRELAIEMGDVPLRRNSRFFFKLPNLTGTCPSRDAHDRDDVLGVQQFARPSSTLYGTLPSFEIFEDGFF